MNCGDFAAQVPSPVDFGAVLRRVAPRLVTAWDVVQPVSEGIVRLGKVRLAETFDALPVKAKQSAYD